MTIDPYLLVRAASLYVALLLTGVVWVWRRPSPRDLAGAALGFAWNLPAVLALHLAAAHFGWWRFEAEGGLLLGMPVELYLSWAWLWGGVAALACRRLPIALVIILALGVDLALMPAAAPVLRLGPRWLAGEAVGLLLGLAPGLLLARWTARRERLAARATLQVVAFAGLMLLVLPAIVIEGSDIGWVNPFMRPMWQLSLIVQLLAVPGLVGLTAVQEFATRGGGTPVPFDPPARIVTTGIYAYIRNPMQLSAVVLLFLLGIVLRNEWVSAAGVMAHIYSVGLAGWDEESDLRKRFGHDWVAYRRDVPRWIPRRRPWHQPDSMPARLFVAAQCGMCREVGHWFHLRGAGHLEIVPAETHPSGELRRITYEPADGSRAASGMEAIARALEHIHLGWAVVAFVIRLPLVCPLLQLLADASGAEPRTVPAAVARES
jgi:protein-S-isoprenylcysteine O-methyltransferase Ste14